MLSHVEAIILRFRIMKRPDVIFTMVTFYQFFHVKGNYYENHLSLFVQLFQPRVKLFSMVADIFPEATAMKAS